MTLEPERTFKLESRDISRNTSPSMKMTLPLPVYTAGERRAFNPLWGEYSLYCYRFRPNLALVSRFVAHAGTPEKSDEPEEKSSPVIRSSRRIVPAFAPPTPVSDMRDISVMLKNPISPEMDLPNSPTKLSPKKAVHGRPVESTPRTDLRTISKSVAEATVESLMRLQMSAQQRTRTTLLTTRTVRFFLWVFV